MITKNKIQKEIKKELKAIERYELEHRSTIERLGTIVLIAATLFSVTGLGHDEDRRTKTAREAVVQTIPVFSAAEKNETVRMPIKFDAGLRATATLGS